MTFAVIVVVPLAAVLLWALYAEQPPPHPVVARRGDWTGLPTPGDVRRRFPLSALGYDRSEVDEHLSRVADAVAALLDERQGQGPVEDVALVSPDAAIVDVPGTDVPSDVDDPPPPFVAE